MDKVKEVSIRCRRTVRTEGVCSPTNFLFVDAIKSCTWLLGFFVEIGDHRCIS
jgi:hypothetical protein